MGLRSRLLLTHVIVAVVALGILGVTADRVFEDRAVRDLRERLVAEARATSEVIARDGVRADIISSLAVASGARLTIIRADGVVLADSEHDPATMENHATRPEVRAALAGKIGTTERVSGTLGTPFLYVALPVGGGIVVRAALPEDRVVRERNTIRWVLAGALAGTTLLAALLSMFVASSVARPLQRISRNVGRVARGETHNVEVEGPNEARALATAINAMAVELASSVEEIRRETALRERILQSMHDAVLLLDGTRVAYANPAATELFGARQGEPVTSSIASLHAGAQDVTLHHPQRRDVQIAVSDTSEGRRLVVARDVTDARRIDRIRRDFVGNASHELKTPAAAILATAETLETAVVDDPAAAKRFASTLAAEARRLSSLVQDLLDLARLEQPLDVGANVDLSSLVLSELDSFRSISGSRAVDLRQEVEAGVDVSGRESDLALLARNLIDNAIRYTPEGGSVTVRLQRNGTHAQLVVEDTGSGISEKDLPRVFERFFRVDEARARATGGTGLGLSIVRHVAESHGGNVKAESRLGEGSRFSVTLPLRTER